MAETERDYYRRRARVELEAALRCDKPEVAAVHQELTKQYLLRVEALKTSARSPAGAAAPHNDEADRHDD